ncbi:hypothetical protein C5S53_10945 [Methanophagales archaeon]|nr:hypothetical protein C5S53_10945 [Methanophagales archaeon]
MKRGRASLSTGDAPQFIVGYVTHIGAEANSGRVSLARGNLKSLRLSLARSTSEPEVGYAK